MMERVTCELAPTFTSQLLRASGLTEVHAKVHVVYHPFFPFVLFLFFSHLLLKAHVATLRVHLAIYKSYLYTSQSVMAHKCCEH